MAVGSHNLAPVAKAGGPALGFSSSWLTNVDGIFGHQKWGITEYIWQMSIWLLSFGKFVNICSCHIQIPRYPFWCILNILSKLFVHSDLVISMFSPIFGIDINSDRVRMLSILVHTEYNMGYLYAWNLMINIVIAICSVIRTDQQYYY